MVYNFEINVNNGDFNLHLIWLTSYDRLQNDLCFYFYLKLSDNSSGEAIQYYVW